MRKNNDLKNIFNSYMNNVVLNEAVMDTEVEGTPRQLTPEQQAAVQKIMSEKGYNKARAELMVLKGQELVNQKNAMQSQGIKPGTTVYTTPQGSASPISTQRIADNGATVQPAPQPVQSQNNDTSNNEEEWDTVETQVVSSQPVATDDSGQVSNTIQFPNYETVAASDDEFEENEEESEDESEIEHKESYDSTQKIKISKFLKHLSEKNYSSAHKYLKSILEYKINKIVSEKINKFNK
jgi:hypothetical protein